MSSSSSNLGFFSHSKMCSIDSTVSQPKVHFVVFNFSACWFPLFKIFAGVGNLSCITKTQLNLFQ